MFFTISEIHIRKKIRYFTERLFYGLESRMQNSGQYIYKYKAIAD